MLASILSKPQRYEPRAYIYDLLNQMQEDSVKKLKEKTSKSERIELNNIYGGVNGNEREKMLKIEDWGSINILNKTSVNPSKKQ
jgi:hypothetical protein